MELRSLNNINFFIEQESETFIHCGVSILNISFSLNQEENELNFFCEVVPIKGNTIPNDISVVFAFYTKEGKIKILSSLNIWADDFFKIDIISDCISFSSIKGLSNFIAEVEKVKIYTKTR